MGTHSKCPATRFRFQEQKPPDPRRRLCEVAAADPFGLVGGPFASMPQSGAPADAEMKDAKSPASPVLSLPAGAGETDDEHDDVTPEAFMQLVDDAAAF